MLLPQRESPRKDKFLVDHSSRINPEPRDIVAELQQEIKDKKELAVGQFARKAAEQYTEQKGAELYEALYRKAFFKTLSEIEVRKPNSPE